jgi:hypothetical protein
MGPLGGASRDLGAPIMNAKKINDMPLGRRCRRFKSVHHERYETSTVDSLGSGVGEPRASAINVKNIGNGPLGGGVKDPGAPTINAKKRRQ